MEKGDVMKTPGNKEKGAICIVKAPTGKINKIPSLIPSNGI